MRPNIAVQPWRPQEQVSLLTGLALSGLVALGGWVGASEQARLVDQYPWFTLAALGIVGSGVVQGRWLLAGFAEVRRRQREVLSELPSRAQQAPRVVNVDAEKYPGLVVVRGATGRYHRADCRMVAGKPTEAWTPSPGESRQPCGLCRTNPTA